MKLRNKKTGKVIEWFNNTDGIFPDTLAELNKDWEDYEDRPYVIDMWEDNCICDAKFGVELEGIERAKECGLYFENKEEAEEAVEKLKAWKRLKDAGCKIVGWDYSDNVDLNGCKFNGDDFIIGLSAGDINEEDLDLLFGGEDDA